MNNIRMARWKNHRLPNAVEREIREWIAFQPIIKRLLAEKADAETFKRLNKSLYYWTGKKWDLPRFYFMQIWASFVRNRIYSALKKEFCQSICVDRGNAQKDSQGRYVVWIYVDGQRRIKITVDERIGEALCFIQNHPPPNDLDEPPKLLNSENFDQCWKIATNYKLLKNWKSN
jgi:hypothetical protein